MTEAWRCANCDDGTVMTILDDEDCPHCDGTGWLGPDGPVDVDRTTADLGGGMVVPLRELLEDDDA